MPSVGFGAFARTFCSPAPVRRRPGTLFRPLRRKTIQSVLASSISSRTGSLRVGAGKDDACGVAVSTTRPPRRGVRALSIRSISRFNSEKTCSAFSNRPDSPISSNREAGATAFSAPQLGHRGRMRIDAELVRQNMLRPEEHSTFKKIVNQSLQPGFDYQTDRKGRITFTFRTLWQTYLVVLVTLIVASQASLGRLAARARPENATDGRCARHSTPAAGRPADRTAADANRRRW